jgi:hypothetical protein
MSRPALLSALLAPVTAGALAASAAGNSWQPLTNQPPFNASTMYLLMDGRVLVNEYFSKKCWLLTPDANGSYLNGTWTQAASMKDDRLYYASGVLADGRVIIGGGEYSNTGGSDKFEIYNPKTDRWKSIAPPSGWGYVGDAPSIVLADGRLMIASLFDQRTAIYDPVADSWTSAANALDPGGSAEQTWILLPDGTFVTCECFGAPDSDLYDPAADAWTPLGPTPSNLVSSIFEIGPGMMLYSGVALQVGGTPHSALYQPAATPGGVGTWVGGGRPPFEGGTRLDAQDAPASILPSGNVLVAMGHGFNAGTYFCEYTGSKFVRVIDPANNGDVPYNGRMLPLPTGEVLFASNSIYLYTADGTPDPSWLPAITSMATDLVPGETYTLSGTQLNGLSSGNSYGDECYVATNYPLVRLTFPATGHVFYARCHDPSTMGIATGSTVVTTRVEIPDGIDLGPAQLEVVANGLASAPLDVVVRDPITIDFDALATGIVVDNQFAEAKFSAPVGYENWTVAAGSGATAPNMICTGTSGGSIDCTEDTYVDFPCPVASLRFDAIGVDDTGTVASINVFESGALTATVPVEGAGDPTTPVHVDLTDYPNVTRIEIFGIVDTGGIGWDDFRFCLSSSAAWSNYGTGYPGTLGEPTLTAGARPILGTSITVALSNSLGADTNGLLIVGFGSAAIGTSAGGTLLVDPLFFSPIFVPAAGASLGGTLPGDPTLCGVEVFLQVLEADDGATRRLSFTPGLDLLLGN